MKSFKILLFLVAFGFISCQNDTVSEPITSEAAVSAEAVIEESESVLDDISIYSESSFGVDMTTSVTGKDATSKSETASKYGHSGFFGDCADIAVSVDGNTITATITFTGDCLDNDGNVITGTITKVWSLTDTNAERTITVDNLSINGYIINGTKTYVFTSSNENGNPEMTGTVDITVETDEGTFSKVGTRTVEITTGGDTDSCYDDEKTISGSFVYTDASGATFSVEITTPLVKLAECLYIASGVKEYTTVEGTTTLDYGDGTCDNIATKTAPDGTVTEIELGRKRHH
ncbi:hypothetical protein V8G69_00385 [Gaetbulibacter sp. M235]|uniref:hypothetical protein n=1 Tax=Gaetbulibacter sp. M235 TaxID=3126510 RepID=UPI00374F79FB